MAGISPAKFLWKNSLKKSQPQSTGCKGSSKLKKNTWHTKKLWICSMEILEILRFLAPEPWEIPNPQSTASFISFIDPLMLMHLLIRKPKKLPGNGSWVLKCLRHPIVYSLWNGRAPVYWLMAYVYLYMYINIHIHFFFESSPGTNLPQGF